MTQDLKFCPSAVVEGSFIKTSMTCSHTGGMEGGAEGVTKVGMLAGVSGRGGERPLQKVVSQRVCQETQAPRASFTLIMLHSPEREF